MVQMPRTETLPIVSTVLTSYILWRSYVTPWEHLAVLSCLNKKVRQDCNSKLHAIAEHLGFLRVILIAEHIVKSAESK